MMCCATPLDWLRERGSCATTLPNTVWLKPPHSTLHCMSELDKEEKSNLALRKKQEKATQRVNKPEFDWIMITEKFSFALESLNVSKSLWFEWGSDWFCYHYSNKISLFFFFFNIIFAYRCDYAQNNRFWMRQLLKLNRKSKILM